MALFNESKNATITIRATDKEKEQLQAIANEQRRTLGGLAYIILTDYLKENAKK